MLDGDISNAVPGRILVTYDYISDEAPSPRKFLGVVVGVRHDRKVNQATVSALSRMSAKVDARLELVVFGSDDAAADAVLEELDRRSWQPFNYTRGYADAFELVSDLPFRPEVLGVIDLADRMPLYGTYGISMDYLARAI